MKRRSATVWKFSGTGGPVLPYYESAGLLKRVDGMLLIDHVTQAIKAILK